MSMNLSATQTAALKADQSRLEADPARTPPLGQRLAALGWDWLGIVPFLTFAVLFLIGPMLYLILGAFQNAEGAFTLDNMIALGGANIVASFSLSIRLSLVSALMGAVAGFLLGHAVVLGGMPAWVRNAFMTFSGVASNFAGVPLAFAFIATLGRLGLVTVLLRDLFGIDLYAAGFNLFSFVGLAVVYL